jgi:hypothetical protein
MPDWWLSWKSGKSRSPVSHCRKCEKKTASVFLTLVLGLPDNFEDEQSREKDGCFSSISQKRNCQNLHEQAWLHRRLFNSGAGSQPLALQETNRAIALLKCKVSMLERLRANESMRVVA